MKTKFFLTAIITVFALTTAIAQTTLQLNLQKGETYYQSSKTNSVTTQTISGVSMVITTTIDAKYSYKVTGADENNYDLEVKYEKLLVSTSMPQMSISYSSENPKDAISSALSGMTKRSFNIKMNKLGEVLEVRNLDKLIGESISQNGGLSEMEKQQIIQLLNEDQFKGSIEMATAIYPKAAVSKGDSWEMASSINSAGISISIKTKYTLAENSGNYNKVMGISTIESDPNAVPMQSQGMSIKYKLSGTGTTQITLDAKSGWITEATIEQKIKGDMQILDGMAAGMNVPISIDNITAISNK